MGLNSRRGRGICSLCYAREKLVTVYQQHRLVLQFDISSAVLTIQLNCDQGERARIHGIPFLGGRGEGGRRQGRRVHVIKKTKIMKSTSKKQFSGIHRK